MDNIVFLAGAAMGVFGLLAFAFTYFKANSAKSEVEKLVLEAEKEREHILSQAKTEAQNTLKELRSEQERDHQAALKKVRNKENEVEKRFDHVNRKQEKLERREKDLENRSLKFDRIEEDLKAREQELNRMLEQEKEELSRVANMSEEQAKEMLRKRLMEDVEAESQNLIADRIQKAKETAEQEANKVIIDAMQRMSQDVTAENTVSTVVLPREDIKGKIIGKDGRNIKAFEKSSGVDVIIDDSPEEVSLSAFDSVRREVARRAMEQLIKDGRIHPQRIEEVVRKHDDEIHKEMEKLGEQTFLEAGFTNVHPELMKKFGRLKFRQSYGQNQLAHSLQVMELCEYIATELGMDSKLAKRCGILHDIGKAVDQQTDGTHPELGAELLKKYGENDIVVNAAAAHHEGVEATSIYTVITAVADAISASRPGARRESTEKYFERMAKIEEVAKSQKGVGKAFAMRAGRELRVAVEPGKVSDAECVNLARKIAKTLEESVTYPGEIKVTCIRETRVIEFAR